MDNMTSINNSINISSFSPVVFFHKMLVNRRDGLSLLEAVMRICKIEGCENKHLAKRYCQKHYQRLKAHGDPLYTKIERHGMRKTTEYNTWDRMIQRCENINDKDYHRYGGRGITVCDRWRNSFLAFFENMGKRPYSKAQIDRINNDGNYQPGNCRWTTCIENIRNSSRVKLSMRKAETIRKLYKIGNFSQSKLGKLYGVGQTNIGKIIRNEIWV